MFRADVEVFEIHAGVAAPGGVTIKIESEACGNDSVCANQFSDDAVKAFGGPEAIAKKVGFRGEDRVWFALIRGEVANEL
jgi:hypothetical protein